MLSLFSKLTVVFRGYMTNRSSTTKAAALHLGLRVLYSTLALHGFELYTCLSMSSQQLRSDNRYHLSSFCCLYSSFCRSLFSGSFFRN